MNPEITTTGWLRVNNVGEGSLWLLIEPWGIGPDEPLQPGESCDIFVASGPGGTTDIDISEKYITLWADR